jgi:glycerophosphoryl diester phosphodiesterase
MKWIPFSISSFINKRKRTFDPLAAPLLIGHRGASGYCPENTFASFDKALEWNVDYIEIDIQVSKDGKIVVFHDSTVDRTTNGHGAVKDYTYEELKKLDAGSWFSPEFTGEKIPLLEEVLEHVWPKAGLIIEIKYPEKYPGIEQKLVELLAKRNITEQIMIQSFQVQSVKTFHKLAPSLPVGVLLRHRSNGISEKKLHDFSAFASFINPKHTMMNQTVRKRIHRHGMKAFTWTVNDRSKIQSLLNIQLDGIATDFPDLLAKRKSE